MFDIKKFGAYITAKRKNAGMKQSERVILYPELFPAAAKSFLWGQKNRQKTLLGKKLNGVICVA